MPGVLGRKMMNEVTAALAKISEAFPERFVS
jgi:hypothetical protein